jgi:hypothetical protein
MSSGVLNLTPSDPNVVAFYNANFHPLVVGGGFVAGAPFQLLTPPGFTVGDMWFSGWWYSTGQLPAMERHSERALCVFLESVYSLPPAAAAALPPPGGGGALPQAPALPVAYANVNGALVNHPNVQPDAVEIYNAIQNTPHVVAVIIHIKNMERMCSVCAQHWDNFVMQYLVTSGNGTFIGDWQGGQVRFIFVVGSGNGGAIEIYQ